MFSIDSFCFLSSYFFFGVLFFRWFVWFRGSGDCWAGRSWHTCLRAFSCPLPQVASVTLTPACSQFPKPSFSFWSLHITYFSSSLQFPFFNTLCCVVHCHSYLKSVTQRIKKSRFSKFMPRWAIYSTNTEK